MKNLRRVAAFFGIAAVFVPGVSAAPVGQTAYTTPGTYSWTAPAGVTSVSVVCVGPGSIVEAGNGGPGGGLGWRNNIPVVPGTTYTVVVGAPGSSDSYFINATTVRGGRGNPSTGYGGSYSGDGGGNGGNITYPFEGAGAGGYSGSGANSRSTGSGGGGGGGMADTFDNGTYLVGSGGGGGGVGILGQGPDGGAGVGFAGGSGGSGGGGGSAGSGYTGGDGGQYGGGPGGGNEDDGTRHNGTPGGGAVRIIWGPNRAFPATNTQDILLPSITSGVTAAAAFGQTFSYQIAASNSPTSYSATGLPAGLAVNASTGLITGTPSQSGTFSVTIGATNSGGAGTATLSMVVASPTFTILSGNNQSAAAGQFNAAPFDVAVWNAAGTAPLVNAPVTFSVTQGGGSLATANTGTPLLFTALTVNADVDGTVQVFYQHPNTPNVVSQIQALAGASQLTLTSTSQALPAPTITTQPIGATIAQGGSITLSVTASGSSALTYQWQRNGTPISGATGRTYTITNATEASAGAYAVVLTDSNGSTTSGAAAIVVDSTEVQNAVFRTQASALFKESQTQAALDYLEQNIAAATSAEKDLAVARQLTLIAFAFHNQKERALAELVADLAYTRAAPRMADTALTERHFILSRDQTVAGDSVMRDVNKALARVETAIRYIDQSANPSALAPARAELEQHRQALLRRIQIQQRP